MKSIVDACTALKQKGIRGNIEPYRPHFFLPKFFSIIYRMVRLLPFISIAFLYFAYKNQKELIFIPPWMEEKKIGIEERKKSDHSTNIKENT